MRKFAYFKLCQAVLTSVFLWQILSTHQFCGDFDGPTAFFNSVSSAGHCEQFTLIGMDSTTGQFGAVSDKQKWQLRLMAANNGGGQPIDEQQQLDHVDEFPAKLPSDGRQCIPITFSLVEPWVRDNKSHLQNVADLFAIQLLCGLLSLFVLTMHVLDQPRSWGYECIDYERATFCAVLWCGPALISSVLLLHWSSYWDCTNFRADATNIPLVTLVLSTVLMCSSLTEIFFNSSLVAKRVRRVNAVNTIQQTEMPIGAANAVVQKNGSVSNEPPNAVAQLKIGSATNEPTNAGIEQKNAIYANRHANGFAQPKNESATTRT